MGSLILLELLISGGINYLLQKAQVDALIVKARLEDRDISLAELATLRLERDRVSDKIHDLLVSS
jgi:hypothetical protein